MNSEVRTTGSALLFWQKSCKGVQAAHFEIINGSSSHNPLQLKIFLFVFMKKKSDLYGFYCAIILCDHINNTKNIKRVYYTEERSWLIGVELPPKHRVQIPIISIMVFPDFFWNFNARLQCRVCTLEAARVTYPARLLQDI